MICPTEIESVPDAAGKAVVATDADIAQNQVSNRLSGLTGLNAQQQSLINSILSAFGITTSGVNQAITTKAGLATAPGGGTIASQNLAGILGAI